MKAISILAILFIGCLSEVGVITAIKSSDKNGSPIAFLTEKEDSTLNYSIKINGKQNSVKIKTDSKTVKTDSSVNQTLQKDNTLTISGTGNSVSIDQKSKGKIQIEQNGNKNQLKISQSNHNP